MELKNDNILPLYLQLTEQLRKDIESGVYKRGQKIPTELELCDLYKVSRITVRKALKELEKENLLVRERGKGTFISMVMLRRDIAHNTSFTKICQATNQTPGAKTIKSVIEEATEEDQEALKLPPGSRVIVLERIRYANSVPVAIEFSRFPERFSFLLDEDLNNASLLSILSEKYGIKFTNSSYKVIKLVYAAYEQAKYLSLSPGYPLISIASLSNDADGTPSHRSLQLIVGDKFELYI